MAKNPIPWLRVGIAVLGCLLICLGAFAWYISDQADRIANDPEKAAHLLVNADPNVELLSTDAARHTLTVRHKKTGKVATVDFATIRDGHLGERLR